jgi:ribosomal protein L16
MFLSSLFGNPLSFATPQTSFLSQLQLRPSSFQKRFAVANYRPKRMLYKKRMKGFFKTHKGGSLRGTSLAHGDYGLQFLEGGRIKDCQLDTIRNNLKRILKTEKEAKLHLNVFPDRPVTAKGNGTRMGKGKGPVDYFGCWVSPGRLAIEISGARKDLSLKALLVAALVF